MEQYIPKSVVLAEIERLQDYIKATAIDGIISKEQAEAYRVCVKLRSFVEDTLETKDVDLEKELDFVKDAYYYFTSDERSSMKKVARHFFELGLKAREDKE